MGNEAWTSRRRLLAALSCGVPDRVPVNTYEMAGRDSRDWYNNQPSYARLMEYIRTRTDCITNWNPQPPNDRYIGTDGFIGSSYPVPIGTDTDQAGDFIRTTSVLHTPAGNLRQVTKKDPSVNTTWVAEHYCKTTADVDRALSVPYEPALYDASDYPRVLAELGDHGLYRRWPRVRGILSKGFPHRSRSSLRALGRPLGAGYYDVNGHWLLGQRFCRRP